jgi:hypothetical protein
VGPKTGLDDVEKRKILPLPGLELGPLGRPDKYSLFLHCIWAPDVQSRPILQSILAMIAYEDVLNSLYIKYI